MARKRATKHRKTSKHGLADDLEDPILQPKTTSSRRPVAWKYDEEGELNPVFAIKYQRTPEEFYYYKEKRSRYRERRRVKRLVSSVANRLIKSWLTKASTAKDAVPVPQTTD